MNKIGQKLCFPLSGLLFEGTVGTHLCQLFTQFTVQVNWCLFNNQTKFNQKIFITVMLSLLSKSNLLRVKQIYKFTILLSTAYLVRIADVEPGCITIN